MTTERRATLRRVASALATASLLFGIWLGVAATAGAYGEFDTLVVLHASPDFWERLPPDVAVLGIVFGAPILRGEKGSLSRDLLEAGATIVMPARLKTCIDLS